MARVLTYRSETGSHPLPLATESLTAYRLVEDRVRGSLQCGNLARLKSARGHKQTTDLRSRNRGCPLYPLMCCKTLRCDAKEQLSNPAERRFESILRARARP